jgi:hypothetical protein
MPKEVRDHMALVLDLIDSIDEDPTNYRLLREAKSILRTDLERTAK